MSVYDDWSDDTKKENPMSEPVRIEKVEIYVHCGGDDPSRIAKLVEARVRAVADARRMRIERPHDGEEPQARSADKPADTRKAKFVLAEAIREVARDVVTLLARNVRELAAATAANTAAIERANALNEVQLRAAAPSPAMPGPPPSPPSPPSPPPPTTTWADFGESPK